MLWTKEVEMVDSVDELNHHDQLRVRIYPNFEMLDARIASALNEIIEQSHFKKKGSLEEQEAQNFEEDRSPS